MHGVRLKAGARFKEGLVSDSKQLGLYADSDEEPLKALNKGVVCAWQMF